MDRVSCISQTRGADVALVLGAMRLPRLLAAALLARMKVAMEKALAGAKISN